MPDKYCPGFIDEAGVWNNGFPCPADSGTSTHYCCGTEHLRYCCPPVAPSEKPSTEKADWIPLAVGVILGATAVTSVLMVVCLVSPACPLYKKRHRRLDIRRDSSRESRPSGRLSGMLATARESLELQQCLYQCQAGNYQHFSLTDVDLTALYPHFEEAPPPYTPEDLTRWKKQSDETIPPSEKPRLLADRRKERWTRVGLPSPRITQPSDSNATSYGTWHTRTGSQRRYTMHGCVLQNLTCSTL